LPWATSLSSIGVVVALTRPVVIATSLIHRSWSFSSTDLPCTPTFATVPPGRMSSVAISKVAGTPTASMATSTPRPSVMASTASRQPAPPLLTASVAPKPLACSTRLPSRSMAMMREAPVEPGGHHRRQTHRSGADDGDDIAGLDAAVAHPDLKAGRAGCRRA
jgi:hypothetical protein